MRQAVDKLSPKIYSPWYSHLGAILYPVGPGFMDSFLANKIQQRPGMSLLRLGNKKTGLCLVCCPTLTFSVSCAMAAGPGSTDTGWGGGKAQVYSQQVDS